jgi:hypothetical protein
MKRITCLVALALLLTACSPDAAPPVPVRAIPMEPRPAVATPTDLPVQPPTVPGVDRAVPEVLARPAAEGGPRRVPFAGGDTVSQVGTYFLNVETGLGEAWVPPGGESGWWGAEISDDNRFIRMQGEKAGYVIDRAAGAVWQWDVETARPVLLTDRGFLFAEVERKDLNRHDTGRLFWTGLDFKPIRTFSLEQQQAVFRALLSPDGQLVALLLRRDKPSVLLLDLGSESTQVLGVPGADQWVGSTNLQSTDGGFEVSAWVSEGNRSTDMPKWHERLRRYNWQGEVLTELHIPGNYPFFSPDGKWVAWQEQDRLGGLAPVTVVADAATLQPHLTVLGASTCFASVGSGGTRWLADSSGIVLSNPSDQYQLLTLDGMLTTPPVFSGLTWKGEPQPAPDRADRFAFGRLQVLDGSRRIGVALEGFVTAQSGNAWGPDSAELRFALPPKPAGGACDELPPMPQLVLRAGEPVPEFPLVVETGECLPLAGAGACLPRGTRLKPVPALDGGPGLGWVDSRWRLFVRTESGQTGWIDLSGSPLGWAR